MTENGDFQAALVAIARGRIDNGRALGGADARHIARGALFAAGCDWSAEAQKNNPLNYTISEYQRLIGECQEQRTALKHKVKVMGEDNFRLESERDKLREQVAALTEALDLVLYQIINSDINWDDPEDLAVVTIVHDQAVKIRDTVAANNTKE